MTSFFVDLILRYRDSTDMEKEEDNITIAVADIITNQLMENLDYKLRLKIKILVEENDYKELRELIKIVSRFCS